MCWKYWSKVGELVDQVAFAGPRGPIGYADTVRRCCTPGRWYAGCGRRNDKEMGDKDV